MRSLEDACVQLEIVNVSDIDFGNLAGSVTNLITAGAIPPSDNKVHAFLLYSATGFVKHGGAQLGDEADTTDRTGFMRRIADVLGDSSLTVARTQAEYYKKQRKASLVASLVLGVTSPGAPGALVSMYIPEAGVEFPAPGIQIPA